MPELAGLLTKAPKGQALRTWHEAAFFTLKQSKHVLLFVIIKYVFSHKMLNQIFVSSNVAL